MCKLDCTEIKTRSTDVITIIGNVSLPAGKYLETPRVMCPTAYGAPSLTNRSAGSKLVLYPSLSSTNLDYAIGVETNDMFFY